MNYQMSERANKSVFRILSKGRLSLAILPVLAVRY